MRKGLFIFAGFILGLSIIIFVATPPNEPFIISTNEGVVNSAFGISMCLWLIDKATTPALAKIINDLIYYNVDTNIQRDFNNLNFVYYDPHEGKMFYYKNEDTLEGTIINRIVWNFGDGRTTITNYNYCPQNINTNINGQNIDQYIFQEHLKYLILNSGFWFARMLDQDLIKKWFVDTLHITVNNNQHGCYLGNSTDCETYYDNHIRNPYKDIIERFFSSKDFERYYNITNITIAKGKVSNYSDGIYIDGNWYDLDIRADSNPNDISDILFNTYSNSNFDFNVFFLIPIKFSLQSAIGTTAEANYVIYLLKQVELKKVVEDKVKSFTCYCYDGSKTIPVKAYDTKIVKLVLTIKDWYGDTELSNKDIKLGEYFYQANQINQVNYSNFNVCYLSR